MITLPRHADSFVFFFGLAWLIKHRNDLLHCQQYDLPLVVNRPIPDEQVTQLIHQAIWYFENTPAFFFQLVTVATSTPEHHLVGTMRNLLHLERESESCWTNNGMDVAAMLHVSLNKVM